MSSIEGGFVDRATDCLGGNCACVSVEKCSLGADTSINSRVDFAACALDTFVPVGEGVVGADTLCDGVVPDHVGHGAVRVADALETVKVCAVGTLVADR